MKNEKEKSRTRNGTKSTNLHVISGTGTDQNDENGTELSNGQVTNIVKQKRKRNRPDLANFGQENVEPGDNSRFIREARIAFDGGLERKTLPPIDISDPEQVKHRISEYLDFCELNDKKPSPVAMASWIGVSRETLNTWKKGEYRTETHSDVIKKAFNLMEEIWYEMMQNGKINPASGIFLAKNMFQYKDVADVVVTPNNPMQDLNAEDARKRLVDAIPADDDE